MSVRGHISALCIYVAVCVSGPAALARGPELVGPPLTTGTGVPATDSKTDAKTDAKTGEKPSASKIEALPLGKPREVAAAPSKAGDGKLGGLLEPGTLTTIGSLIAVLGVIAIVAFFARKASLKAGGLWSAIGPGGRAPSGILEVLGRYPVGRGCTLVLLKLDRRILLVSQSSGGKLGGVTMTTLTEVTDVEDVASILLKSRDAETEQSMQKFEHMLTDADRAFTTTRRGEIQTEPVPLPVRNVKRTTAGSGGAASMQSRLDSLRRTNQVEVRG